MQFSWHTEKYGYALKDGRGYPYAVMHRKTEGYWVFMIDTGLPTGGPYHRQTEAAEWVEGMILRRFEDAAFSEFPWKRGQPAPEIRGAA